MNAAQAKTTTALVTMCCGGALVKSVEPGSAAAQSGLRNNDVIMGANRGRITNVQQLRERAATVQCRKET